LLVVVLIVLLVLGLRRVLGAPREETLQAVAIFLLVAFAVLTVTGVWFRGEGMALTWPWRIP
jgi:hypothetical protein